MRKIDADYLWLHEQPRRQNVRLKRVALLLVIPLIGGAAWLTSTPDYQQPIDPAVADRADLPASDAIDASSTAARPRPANDRALADGRLSEFSDDARPLSINTVDTLADEPTSPGAAPVAEDETTPIDLAVESRLPGDHWEQITIREGETLSIAFNRHDLSYNDSLQISHLEEHGDRFTRGLRPGDSMRVKTDGAGRVVALDFEIDPLRTLEVRSTGSGFEADVALADVKRRRNVVTGTIDSSFYINALEAGLSDRQIMRLVKLFGWDVDFAFDISAGDRFMVVYDELYRDGQKVANDEILAASFINKGRELRAIRFESADGEVDYYSPDGRAMKKAFLRTPVEYTRISSRFNPGRRHPVLNRIRRHEGTDYAAPTGTPIKATGNGRIVFRGRRGGYGNMVIIKHDSELTTRYGHMSSFNGDFGTGSKVRQGDVIGYVGASGLATGPHLHYEFRVNGDAKDPEKITLPKARPLGESELAEFRRESAPLLAQLDSLSESQIALRDDDATSAAD